MLQWVLKLPVLVALRTLFRSFVNMVYRFVSESACAWSVHWTKLMGQFSGARLVSSFGKTVCCFFLTSTGMWAWRVAFRSDLLGFGEVVSCVGGRRGTQVASHL
eukprot:962062-Amphidinium_carterae.1